MSLNDQQAEAVFYNEGPLLVLAGAGSGKTKVITQRILHLIGQKEVAPSRICAVTFTNKAATEMKERLRQLTKKPLRGIFVGTYHSLGLKILKENTDKLPLSEKFSIQGQDDQLAIVGEIQREFKIDNDQIPDKLILWNFSKTKNCGLPARQLSSWLADKLGPTWGDYFERYQKILNNYNSVDFDDLILMPRDLLAQNEELRQQYQKKWQYFLADEFQDTNPLQFDFLKLMLSPPFNLCAVGDDDQSIYGWRGADISIILNYKDTFPNAKIVALEQNYRSTQNILDLANATIGNNSGRHPKRLWSANGLGSQSLIFEAEYPEDEADFITDKIEEYHSQYKIPYNEIAILFRTNFQSRPFEESLRQKNIPYNLVGGYQFYDRKEIKDLLGYLRFFANHADEKSLVRALSFPKRNIGDTTINKLRSYCLLSEKTMWQVIEEIESCPVDLKAAALSGILEFRDLVKNISPEFHRPKNLTNALRKLIEAIDPEKEFIRMALEEQVIHAKMLNIKDLINSIYSFETDDRNRAGDGESADLFTYLQFVALMMNDSNDKENQERVQLMTLHVAKGLEFDLVFLAGLEDGTLPHKRSIDPETASENSLEEERRLFYVGITRAKQYLFFSFAANKKNYQGETVNTASRFLSELPDKLISWDRLTQDGDAEKDGLAGFDLLLNSLKS